jgi:hypothetical protein
MASPSEIEIIVMRRVRLIRILTLIISTVTLATLTAIAALWGIGREVWVAHVFQNMPAASSGNAFLTFWLTAFTHTRLVVQVLTLCTVASLLFLLLELAHSLSGFFSRRTNV